ncbi:hypothetical protein CYY_009724 [Polysphondylium violaceum]|uniref:Uncharacterized protein n=1 Tax=Polysphondylium violaceum TaxID=133409 RepID=A0A8J4PL70_9MYCE|nr:hypothetical protein CYY_009724 [Polysphondylium violaceum]
MFGYIFKHPLVNNGNVNIYKHTQQLVRGSCCFKRNYGFSILSGDITEDNGTIKPTIASTTTTTTTTTKDLQQIDTEPNKYILFNGSKNYYPTELNTFLTHPRNISSKKRTKKNFKQAAKPFLTERNNKLTAIHNHIKNTSEFDKKVFYTKFAEEYASKSKVESIHVELKKRDHNRVYDEITLDPPVNPEIQLADLMNSIKINSAFLKSTEEKDRIDQILSGLIDKQTIIDTNKAHSKEFESAKQAYIMGNVERAFPVFERLANEHCHGLAHVFLGNMYFNGSPITTIDYKKAYHHFYLAATKTNVAVAFGMLGEMNFKGLGVPLNLPEARIHFMIASDLGLRSSTDQLIYMITNKIGGEYNILQVAHYLKNLIAKGSVESITTLGGVFFDTKKEFSKDLWLFASKMGDPTAQFLLGRYYYSNENPDYQNALLLWNSAGSKGHIDAQFYLAGMYDMGLIVERSSKKAAQLYEMCAKKGHVAAQYLIGKAYYTGDGIEMNQSKGLEYLKMSSENGDEMASNFLKDIDNFNNSNKDEIEI